MNEQNIEDIISATKLNEILHKRDDDKIKKTILWTLATVGAMVAIAGIVIGIIMCVITAAIAEAIGYM